MPGWASWKAPSRGTSQLVAKVLSAVTLSTWSAVLLSLLEGGAELPERLAHGRRDAPPGIAQRDAARAAQEQGPADALLQELDLIAHRRLRHPELFCGARKAQMAGGGLEAADRGERREGREGHKVTLC